MTTRPIGSTNGAWLLSTVRDEDWRKSAACSTADPSLFDERHVVGESPDVQAARHKQAKAICDVCPVAKQCLDSAVRGVDEGVRGGRRLPPIIPRQHVKPPAEIAHGTERGAQQHRRRKEQPCTPCAQAAARAHVDRDRKRAEREAAKAARKPTPCGTASAAKRHWVAGEACDVCRTARNERERQQRAARNQARAQREPA